MGTDPAGMSACRVGMSDGRMGPLPGDTSLGVESCAGSSVEGTGSSGCLVAWGHTSGGTSVPGFPLAGRGTSFRIGRCAGEVWSLPGLSFVGRNQ